MAVGDFLAHPKLLGSNNGRAEMRLRVPDRGRIVQNRNLREEEHGTGLVAALLALAREFLGSRQSRTARLQAWPPPRRSVVDHTSGRTCARRHSQSRTARRRRRASFRTLGRTQRPKGRRAGTGDTACRKASHLVEAGTGRTGDESLVSRAVWVNPVTCPGSPAVHLTDECGRRAAPDKHLGPSGLGDG